MPYTSRLQSNPNRQTIVMILNAHATINQLKSKVRIMNAATGMSISERRRRNAMPADLASYTKHAG